MKRDDQWVVAVGAMVSKICHSAPDGFHCTFPGVSCGIVADLFPFGSVLLISEEETDKIFCSALLKG